MEDTVETSQIMSFGVALLGCFLAWHGIRLHRLASASASWPAATGTILACRIRRDYDEDTGKHWILLLEYEYLVGGERFTSGRVRFGEDNPRMTEMESLRVGDRYPLQSPVTVFYNPANPAQAVLEAGETRNALALAAVGVLMALFGTGYGLAG